MEFLRGFWVTQGDVHCRQAVFGQVSDIDKVLPYTRDRRVCVQAGGNWGVWAARLALEFEDVYTFEPDEDNFACLLKNVPDNVFALCAAIGDVPDSVGLYREKNNAGAHRISGSGEIPVTTIDSLDLKACDLIILDIEGYEPRALRGAENTIKNHKPVLMIEDKGITEHYGVPEGWTDNIDGYRVVERIHRDVILVPE